jgi:type II secretory pathway pseudopilin PulG
MVELMVVILIVGILAAAATPLMRGRIDSTKWSEGKSMMGTIATAIRVCIAEDRTNAAAGSFVGDFSKWGGRMGFMEGDFKGNYFAEGNFSITACSYAEDTETLTFTIEATAPIGINYPGTVTLDETGKFAETE